MISSLRKLRWAGLYSEELSMVLPAREKKLRIGRACLVAVLIMMVAAFGRFLFTANGSQMRFQTIPTQFIAALGSPDANSGSNAQSWGLWPLDPGPRGVQLRRFEQLEAAGGVAPSRWKFDRRDWWLEEHGIIMEQPSFPLPPGKYKVTGNREVTTVLTIYPVDNNGNRRWELDDHATLLDVTHLACRSARYTPTTEGSCSPAKAQKTEFPVDPGGVMPQVEGCEKQDYAVLFVVAVAVEDEES